MAKRAYSKKGNKIEPSELTLRFPTANFTGTRTLFIDLSQAASLINRRFYRQGINWAVAGFKVISTGADTVGAVTISKLPNTWVMSNAWEKGMRAWMKMNREALAETPSVRPKFLDFKIYADADHFASGYGLNLLPYSRLAGATLGEWEPSKIVVPFGPASPGLTSDLSLMAVGANYNGGVESVVSLIEGYAASRGLPEVLDPNAPSDASDTDGSTPENWLSAIFNEGTDQISDVIEDLITENNIAPYPFENGYVQGSGSPGTTHPDTMYPGGANQLTGLMVHDENYISSTTIGGSTRLKGGNFPCGLIRLDLQRTSGETGNYIIQIDMVPGNHRGYLCEPMTEM